MTGSYYSATIWGEAVDNLKSCHVVYGDTPEVHETEPPNWLLAQLKERDRDFILDASLANWPTIAEDMNEIAKLRPELTFEIRIEPSSEECGKCYYFFKGDMIQVHEEPDWMRPSPDSVPSAWRTLDQVKSGFHNVPQTVRETLAAMSETQLRECLSSIVDHCYFVEEAEEYGRKDVMDCTKDYDMCEIAIKETLQSFGLEPDGVEEVS